MTSPSCPVIVKFPEPRFFRSFHKQDLAPVVRNSQADADTNRQSLHRVLMLHFETTDFWQILRSDCECFWRVVHRKSIWRWTYLRWPQILFPGALGRIRGHRFDFTRRAVYVFVPFAIDIWGTDWESFDVVCSVVLEFELNVVWTIVVATRRAFVRRESVVRGTEIQMSIGQRLRTVNDGRYCELLFLKFNHAVKKQNFGIKMFLKNNF